MIPSWASRLRVCGLLAFVLVLACCGLSTPVQAQVSLERIYSQARLLDPDLPALSALQPAEVPAVIATLKSVSSAAAEPRALYSEIVRGKAALQGLAAEQRQQLWDAVFRHPVAGLDDEKKLKKYDPQGVIGFCFGRSMAAHLLARKLGLAEDSVRNLFVIGDLREGADPEWRFHVTALVKGEDGAWYAIDPIMEGPMTSSAWMAAVRNTWDKGRKAKFYMTPASTILPDVTVVPESGQEKGVHIIELSFDSAGKAGFSTMPGLGDEVFSVSADAVLNYFKDVDAAAGAFDFAGTPVNDMHISYNGYFADLLRDITAGVQGMMQYAEPRPAGPKVRPLGLRPGRLQPR